MAKHRGWGMVEVYAWEPNANSGKPLLALHEKGVLITCQSIVVVTP